MNDQQQSINITKFKLIHFSCVSVQTQYYTFSSFQSPEATAQIDWVKEITEIRIIFQNKT